mmetsp:Transcript_24316/g.52107  ORF Transcript_24316/g.52107 Transcript_24316/m.52107 type:complete len:214 (+) Transcript_24316:102-743(+)
MVQRPDQGRPPPHARSIHHQIPEGQHQRLPLRQLRRPPHVRPLGRGDGAERLRGRLRDGPPGGARRDVPDRPEEEPRRRGRGGQHEQHTQLHRAEGGGGRRRGLERETEAQVHTGNGGGHGHVHREERAGHPRLERVPERRGGDRVPRLVRGGHGSGRGGRYRRRQIGGGPRSRGRGGLLRRGRVRHLSLHEDERPGRRARHRGHDRGTIGRG